MRGWVNKLKTKGLNCCSDPSIMANARLIRGVSWIRQRSRNKVDKIPRENTFV